MIKRTENEKLEGLFDLFYPIDFYAQNDEEGLEDKKNYQTQCISVFDHWLNEDECTNAKVMSYNDILSDIHAKKIYDEYETKFLNFYSYLYDNTEIYGRLFADGGNALYVTFTTKETYLSHVLLSVREQLFLKIVLPEYHAIIDGGYDLTHILRVKKGHLESLEAISKIVDQHGLYILS
jgi:hypothetical protein